MLNTPVSLQMKKYIYFVLYYIYFIYYINMYTYFTYYINIIYIYFIYYNIIYFVLYIQLTDLLGNEI